jgi:pilus assembly protein CpaE
MPVKKNTVKLNIQTLEFNDILGDAIKRTDGFSLISGQTEYTRRTCLSMNCQADWEQELEEIRRYIETAEHTDVFIVSEKSDPQVLIQALRVGVKEFLPAPLHAAAVAEALARFQERQEKKIQKSSGRLGRIISLIGSKGGVGTTTIAVNLADCLTRKSDHVAVALMDMNMVFSDIPMFLDISPKHDWGDITKNIERLDEFFLSNILTRSERGLDILPSPGYLDNNSSLPTPRIITTLMEFMTKSYDYIIVDLGQSINGAALKIINLSNRVEIVMIQTLPCLSIASRLIKSLLDNNYTSRSNLSLILNRYIKKGLVDLQTAEEGLGQKISWLIPNDYTTTMSAINSGKTLMETDPKSKIARCFEDYSDTLLPENAEKTRKKGWFFK